MNKQYEQVREVHNAFGQDMPDKPEKMKTGETAYDRLMLKVAAEHLSKTCLTMKTHGTASDVMQRASWMLEELVEFMNAETLEDQVDALTDLIYFAIGTFTLMGVKPEPFFDIVHAANMGKLWEDGKPRFDEQGKWIKPEGWAEKCAPEPKIVQELMRQSMDA